MSQSNTDDGRSGADAPSGCQPSASAAEEASSRSGIPNAARLASLEAAFAAFPRDVWQVAECLGDGEYCQTGPTVAGITGVPLKRVQAIHRALRVLGFAEFGTLQREDDGVPVGSGYWWTRAGWDFMNALDLAQSASGMSALGQDAQWLEAKPASPTAATSGGDAQQQDTP
jgi:hypothetical protein